MPISIIRMFLYVVSGVGASVMAPVLHEPKAPFFQSHGLQNFEFSSRSILHLSHNYLNAQVDSLEPHP